MNSQPKRKDWIPESPKFLCGCKSTRAQTEQNFEHKSLGLSWNPLGVLHILCKCGRAFLISLLCVSQHMGRGRPREVPFIQKTLQELGHRIPHSHSINSQHLRTPRITASLCGLWALSAHKRGTLTEKAAVSAFLWHTPSWVRETASYPWTRPDGKLILNSYAEGEQPEAVCRLKESSSRTNSLHLKLKLTKTASCQADTVVVRVTSCLIVLIVSTRFFCLWGGFNIPNKWVRALLAALKSLLEKAGGFLQERSSHTFL